MPLLVCNPLMGHRPFPRGASAFSLWSVGRSPMGRRLFPYGALAFSLWGVFTSPQKCPRSINFHVRRGAHLRPDFQNMQKLFQNTRYLRVKGIWGILFEVFLLTFARLKKITKTKGLITITAILSVFGLA